MAFLKFRWPGAQNQDEDTPSFVAAQAAAAPSVEAVRRKARNRLIGLSILVVLAIIVFPMVFNTEPRPVPVDIPIVIPSQDRTGSTQERSGTVGTGTQIATVPQAPIADNANAAATTPPQPQNAEASAPVMTPDAPAVTLATEKPATSATMPAAATNTRPESKPEPKPVTKPQTRPAANDADRARALLEGRTTPSRQVASAADTNSGSVPAVSANGKFVVQVGAFSDVRLAQSAQQKLEKIGVRSYTQNIDTSAGQRTRVRVGPFASRDDAEKAAARIKSQGLPAAVLTLN